jgi:hypothetical protein
LNAFEMAAARAAESPTTEGSDEPGAIWTSQLVPALRTPCEHPGCKEHDGGWRTEEQVAAERREAQAGAAPIGAGPPPALGSSRRRVRPRVSYCFF